MIVNSKINKKPLFLIKKYFKKIRKMRENLTDKNKFLQVSLLNLKRYEFFTTCSLETC